MKNIFKSIVLLALLTGASTAYSANSYYLGASGGRSAANHVCNSDAIAVVNSCDNVATTYKVFVDDINFSKNIGLELSYNDYGSYTAAGTNSSLNANVKARITGITVGVIGIFPVSNKIDVFGKIGVITLSQHLTGSNNSVYFSNNYTDTAASFNIGFDVKVTSNIVLRTETETFKTGSRVPVGTITTLTVGAAYKF